MKRIVLAVLTTAVLVSLSGCNHGVEVERKVKEYEVVHINPPKRFYVDLKDVETGVVYKSEYVSKRCSYWKRLELGTKWKFTEITYRNDEGKLTYRLNGVNTLCDSLRSLPDK